jgi:hypothetical protein
MYFAVNEEKIYINFNPSVYVKISGPDNFYYVELREYKKGEDKSLFIEGYHITDKENIKARNFFSCLIEFYYDFEIIIYKFIDGIGLQKLFVHRFNDNGKLVLFNLETENYGECNLWIDRIKVYQQLHGCKIAINSKFDDLNKKHGSFYNTNGIDHYKTYNIGRFAKSSYDWRTIDPRKDGVIWYGNWKTFWSYQHPNQWNQKPSKKIIDDILGL